MTVTTETPDDITSADVPECTAISICFTSRGRPLALSEALHSLYDRADRPEDIEAIIAVDPDDRSYDGVALPERVRLWVAPERYGYTRLHDYLNQIAEQAKGDWIQWFNDDMRNLTDGWDTMVREHRPAVLWPHGNHVQHANIAPIWPRSWSDANGIVTPTTHMDTFLQRVGEYLGRHDHFPMTIVHMRSDVTGDHDDQTYQEGRKPLGPEGMVGHFPAEEVGPYAEVIRAAGLL